MRHALDTVRVETDAIARSHMQLMNSLRKELEAPLNVFMMRIEALRRDSQTTVTKLYKHKQTQLQYVQRSREKYENDCTKINAYTAQSNLVQGRELDKVMAKLERSQATVGANGACHTCAAHNRRGLPELRTCASRHNSQVERRIQELPRCLSGRGGGAPRVSQDQPVGPGQCNLEYLRDR